MENYQEWVIAFDWQTAMHGKVGLFVVGLQWAQLYLIFFDDFLPHRVQVLPERGRFHLVSFREPHKDKPPRTPHIYYTR